MAEKIFPRNLTARAGIMIAGNPVTTRLESGVGNCFPGLEYDQRNLDRRFFPGLVFNFGGTLPVFLAAVEQTDPALEPQPGDDDATAKAIPALSQAVRDQFPALTRSPNTWILASIAQGGRTVDTAATAPYDDGLQIWRLVRSLEREQVTITLRQAADAPASARGQGPKTIRLTHFRRRYIDPDKGVLSPVYRPGELTQSMCSPWQHDFRDCACDYWASNHPDIVLGGDLPNGAELPSGIPVDDGAPLAGPTTRTTLSACVTTRSIRNGSSSPSCSAARRSPASTRRATRHSPSLSPVRTSWRRSWRGSAASSSR